MAGADRHAFRPRLSPPAADDPRDRLARSIATIAARSRMMPCSPPRRRASPTSSSSCRGARWPFLRSTGESASPSHVSADSGGGRDICVGAGGVAEHTADTSDRLGRCGVEHVRLSRRRRLPGICANAYESVSIRGNEVILVVEDDPQVARLVALVLQRNGRDCQVVADGTTALLAREGNASADDLRRSHHQRDERRRALQRVESAATKPDRFPMSSSPAIATSPRKRANAARTTTSCKPFEFPDLIRLVEKYARTES